MELMKIIFAIIFNYYLQLIHDRQPISHIINSNLTFYVVMCNNNKIRDVRYKVNAAFVNKYIEMFK